LKVEKKAVSEGFLDPAGRPEEQNPPHISEPANPQGQCKDLPSVEKEAGRRDRSPGEVIDGMFDNPRNDELKDIDDEQGDQSDEDSPSVFHQIISKGLKRLHEDP
jgi:hypothetical protein